MTRLSAMNGQLVYQRLLKFITLLLLTLGLVTCSGQLTSLPEQSAPQNKTEVPETHSKLRIWWTQGFLAEENQAIVDLVAKWEQETGLEAELSLLPDRDILADTQTAIEAKSAPDILFSSAGGESLVPLLAWDGQLEDLSSLIAPMQKQYDPVALDAVRYKTREDQTGKYYALPIGQAATHIHYWKSSVEQAGFQEKDIPQQWDRYWGFWKQVQDRLRRKGEKVYGLGLTLSDLGRDTAWEFEQFLEAYNIRLIDDKGRLLIDEPAVRQGIVQTIQQLADFYRRDYVPPDSTEWTDAGNNRSFLEHQSLLVLNNTLSIPLTQKQPDNQYNQFSRDIYLNDIRTAVLPDSPNGQPTKSMVSIKQLMMLKQPSTPSAIKQAAKSFLTYFSKPENINVFLQRSGKGRFSPVIPALLKDPFWSDSTDPHMTAAREQYERGTRPLYLSLAPAYSQVWMDNVWAKAILSVIQQKVTPEQAADQGISQVKKIFREWS